PPNFPSFGTCLNTAAMSSVRRSSSVPSGKKSIIPVATTPLWCTSAICGRNWATAPNVQRISKPFGEWDIKLKNNAARTAGKIAGIAALAVIGSNGIIWLLDHTLDGMLKEWFFRFVYLGTDRV